MKKTIFLIILLVCLPLFSASAGTMYRCVNSKGAVMMTTEVPTNPDYRCASANSYKDIPEWEEREHKEKRAKADAEWLKEQKAETARILEYQKQREKNDQLQDAINEERNKRNKRAMEIEIKARDEGREMGLPGKYRLDRERDAAEEANRLRKND